MKSAFLVIDAQPVWATNCVWTLKAIEKAAETARQKGTPVIWAYMNFLPADLEPVRFGDLKLSHAFKLANEQCDVSCLPAIQPHDKDWILSKGKPDVFTNPANAIFLRKQGIARPDMAGFRTSECFHASALGGIREGFHPRVSPDITADRNDRFANTLDFLFGKTEVEIGTPIFYS
jgi:nicotinamidase-related amidase